MITSLHEIDHLYLNGWKEMGRFAGVTGRTIKTWHYKKLRAPLMKSSRDKQGRVRIAKHEFMRWLKALSSI